MPQGIILKKNATRREAEGFEPREKPKASRVRAEKPKASSEGRFVPKFDFVFLRFDKGRYLFV